LRKDHAIKPHDYQGLHDTAGNVRKLQETNRTKLKIEFRKECWFDPGQGHQVHLGFAIISSVLGLVAWRSW
jgi:hypothetical protein